MTTLYRESAVSVLDQPRPARGLGWRRRLLRLWPFVTQKKARRRLVAHYRLQAMRSKAAAGREMHQRCCKALGESDLDA